MTLTQVDTKLIELELLDKVDNTEEENARVIEKDLSNLQVLRFAYYKSAIVFEIFVLHARRNTLN